MIHHYFCYGLHISSELEMPEMTPCRDHDSAPEVLIRLAALPAEAPAHARRLHQTLWLGDQLLRLHIRDVAHYEVRDGREILIDPQPGADPKSLRVYLQGSALGALLMQRDYLVLHGNAVRIGDACMICVGHSGAGKSTLAAAFLGRGHDILADDVVPIRPDGLAIPGFPRIKLWQDAADHLGITTDGLSTIMPGMDKFNLPLQRDEQALEPLPVRWIYLLDWYDGDELLLEEIQGVARFTTLHSQLYRPHFLSGNALLAQRMAQCARLACQVRVVRVRRPADKSLSPVFTAERLLADMLTTTPPSDRS